MRPLTFTLLLASQMPTAVLASTVVALPEGDLARRVDAIALGEVIDTETYAGPTGSVVTEAKFRVHIGVKGVAAGDVIPLMVPGGTISGLSYEVTGAPRLARGQLWVVFVTWHPTGAFTPWGLRYGMLPVHRVDGGHLTVRSELDGLNLVQPSRATSSENGMYLRKQRALAFLEAYRGAPSGEW